MTTQQEEKDGAGLLVLDVEDDVRILKPFNPKTGKVMEDVEIPVRYIGMAERGEIGRRHQIVEGRMQARLETTGYYAEIVRKGIVYNDKYQWKGIVDKNGKPVPCTDDAKDRLPAYIADQVITIALPDFQKQIFATAVLGALSDDKEASADAENPTSA